MTKYIRYRARNITGNKHFKPNQTDNIKQLGEALKIQLQQDPRIRYCLFTIEQSKKHKNTNQYHFQGYLELNVQIDIAPFAKRYQLTDCQASKGSIKDNQRYIEKDESKVLDENNNIYRFEYGKPKRSIKRYNTLDDEIPHLIDDQRILLNHRLKDNHYKRFNDIEQDLELLFLKHNKWCKNLGDRYHPAEALNVEPLKTIGIYGHSGIGKSFGTNQLLQELGYLNSEIACKKASNETSPKLWFNIEDEGKKVLWIEEVRFNFPNFNDMIQFIDRKDGLPVKGSQIKNTFELLIVNSLHSPEYIYKNLPFGHQVEVLRRLYKGNQSEVGHLIPNADTYNTKTNITEDLPDTLLKHYEHQSDYKGEI